jgi:hypothetical protein
VFAKIDKNNNGTLSINELRDGLKYLHLEPNHVDVDKLFISIHHKIAGEITFDEFEEIFGMLNLDDLSYLYRHQYAMFDGGSASLLVDYRKLLSSMGINSNINTSIGALGGGHYDFYIRMVTAGIAGGFAQVFVNPFETVKVRLQTEGTAVVKKYKNFVNGFKIIAMEEGIKGLWKGISPAISRDLIYTSSRMGLYKPIKEMVHNYRGVVGPETIIEKLISGGSAGAFAAFLGNPADLLKARMQVDSTGKMSSLGHIKDILRNHGISGFYLGSQATVTRAVILGSVKMATYDEAKGKISKLLGCNQSDVKVVVLGSILSSYCLTLASSPIDLVRTRMMTSSSDSKQSITSTFRNVIRTEGFLGLYKGFYPLWARNCPYNIMQFMIWEKLCSSLKVSIT